MMKPPTIEDAEEAGLLVFLPERGIHTFSNGDHWDYWASRNCFECRFYAPNRAGALCAFEGAALLGSVSPKLAEMFGWLESEKYPGSYHEPETCAFFRDKNDRGDDDPPKRPAPPTDPRQLVLLADPTEDDVKIAARTTTVTTAHLGR